MKRKLGLILVFGAALPLAVASAAWACGVLATLSVNTKVASPGQTVTVTGKNWGTAAGSTPVTIRLKSRTGQVLTTTAAQAGGGISETFALPTSLSPGWYVILGMQSVNGTAKTGTPGRTTIRVQGAAQGAAVAAAPWGSSTPAGPAASAASTGGSGSLIAIMLAATLSLTMLVGGWKILSRASRSAAEPQFGV